MDKDMIRFPEYEKILGKNLCLLEEDVTEEVELDVLFHIFNSKIDAAVKKYEKYSGKTYDPENLPELKECIDRVKPGLENKIIKDFADDCTKYVYYVTAHTVRVKYYVWFNYRSNLNAINNPLLRKAVYDILCNKVLEIVRNMRTKIKTAIRFRIMNDDPDIEIVDVNEAVESIDLLFHLSEQED